MLAGIGGIIIMKQLPHAFGYDTDFEGDLSF
jgi:MFS superfamily sulfate permease-like transporter